MKGKGFKPGDIVRWYANTRAWSRIAKYNIIVEGIHDQHYFDLAANLYRQEYGLELIGEALAIFPAGEGEQGGTLGIQRVFPTLRQLIAADTLPNGKPLFRAIALLDNDSMGKRTLNGLTAKHLGFRQYRDIFLLHRKYPVTPTRDSNQLIRLIAAENTAWSNLDCVIEDLVSWELLNLCCEEHPDYFERETMLLNGAHHCKFRVHAKAPFFRCVAELADVQGLVQLVDALKFLRHCLGLAPEGDPI